jgi:bisphosphoglycerate-independent phosphoglycerate mutase (AlkP superfamily)
VITSKEAGIHLWQIAQRYSFTLFEYWLTDYAGHARDMAGAVEVLERFDGLLGGLMEKFDPTVCTLLITSDHGNIEDLSTKSHTRVPVPCIIAGRKRDEISSTLSNLTHVTPSILSLLSNAGLNPPGGGGLLAGLSCSSLRVSSLRRLSISQLDF